MRLMNVFWIGGFIIALTGAFAGGQETFSRTADNVPPADRVRVFTVADLESKMKESRLADCSKEGSYSV
jgi:hypothetical protein